MRSRSKTWSPSSDGAALCRASAGDGPLAALDDRPRPGKEPTITPEAKAWLVSLACDKAKDHGYPHELWTTRLLARHAREHGPAAGHACLTNLVLVQDPRQGGNQAAQGALLS
ncbi:helix-turn-helix domain-containing protein [Bradyrhizobium barranii]|uniref:helix-turn-helix domain-containing protein n=1 Tax=Bradyrhizobium TaxID=374 RepID=UPI003F267994